MDYPFINAKELTDDELMKRIQRCTQILTSESYWGHNSMVESARMQLDAYQFEWTERMQTKSRKEELERNPNLDDPIEVGTVGEYYDPDEKNDDTEEQ